MVVSLSSRLESNKEERSTGRQRPQLQLALPCKFSAVRFVCRYSCMGSYLRVIDSCITQLKAQGPSRTCNESKEAERRLLHGGEIRLASGLNARPTNPPVGTVHGPSCKRVATEGWNARCHVYTLSEARSQKPVQGRYLALFFFFTRVTGPRRSLDLKLSETRVYEP
jgi:hypothetical protein